MMTRVPSQDVVRELSELRRTDKPTTNQHGRTSCPLVLAIQFELKSMGGNGVSLVRGGIPCLLALDADLLVHPLHEIARVRLARCRSP